MLRFKYTHSWKTSLPLPHLQSPYYKTHQKSTKFINIIKTGTCRPMTMIKPPTLLPQCGALGGVLLLLSLLPLEQKPHSTILIAPGPGLLKNWWFMAMPPLPKWPPPHAAKKATPALKHPATVDDAKDEDNPTLMQLKCPTEVKTQQNATTEDTQTLSQLKDPPVF